MHEQQSQRKDKQRNKQMNNQTNKQMKAGTKNDHPGHTRGQLVQSLQHAAAPVQFACSGSDSEQVTQGPQGAHIHHLLGVPQDHPH